MISGGEHKVIILRTFFFESKAQLYAAKLKDADIPCFISNAHTGTMLPMGSGSFVLHIRESDKDEALQIIGEMDRLDQTPADESFREADLGDIDYQRRLHNARPSPKSTVWLIVILVLILALIIAGILFRRYNLQSVF